MLVYTIVNDIEKSMALMALLLRHCTDDFPRINHSVVKLLLIAYKRLCF